MNTYSWHEDFYKRKVFPQICKDAGACSGFFAWLEIRDRQLYDEILRWEQEIDDIWKAKGDQESFRKACKEWYDAVMKGLGKWREAVNPGTSQRAGGMEQRVEGPQQARLL